MKKGLSVLLIAAALFGFYGGAVNLNDVLACKDYWEKEDERTTADLNKLEDGLNQLKENEQAYLDGLDTLAEGEQALADGEAAFAAGQAELAKGEADYAAAPGKLADARKQLADGEKALAQGKSDLKDGKKSLSDLDKLIKGLKKANTSFNNYSIDDNGKKGMAWKTGFEKKASKKDFSDAGLQQARQVITKTLNDKKDSVALIEGLVKTPGLLDAANNADKYSQFDSALKNLSTAFGKASKKLKEIASMAEQYAADTEQTEALKAGAVLDTAIPQSVNAAGEITATKAVKDCTISETNTAIGILDGSIATLNAYLDGTKMYDYKGTELDLSKITEDSPYIEVKKGVEDKLETATTSKGQLDALVYGRQTLQSKLNGVIDKYGSDLEMAASGDSDIAALYGLMKALANDAVINPSTGQVVPGMKEDNKTFAQMYTKLQGGLTLAAAGLREKAAEADQSKASFDSWRKGYKQLKDGKDQLASTSEGIPYAFSKMLSNSTIKKALKKDAKSVIPTLQKYSGTRLNKDDLDTFDKDMASVSKAIKKVLPILYELKSSGQKSYNQGQKDLAAGKSKLAAGRKAYAEGLASYYAAPAKLAAGRAKLADAEQQLNDGRKQLADGKEKLAEYEDGEQQVRDGLATLMASEANGGLQSILDRRSGDEDFDNGDEHLELNEGLDAVSVGREYKADSGELVTAEIMKRAIGTGLGLAAGALAVLAGLLSLLKKNKGAGVCAALTAIAGGAGIAAGTSAGMEFSSIAGSAVGATPWIAFGVLAAVAAVHAIAHFTDKPEA